MDAVRRLTVLYDEGCGLCRRFSRWLAAQPQLVPMEFVPAGSALARDRFPALDHAATLREVTVVGDGGQVYTGDRAWVACLWATVPYRPLSERLASPAMLPVTRQVVAAFASLRITMDTGEDTCDDAGVDAHPYDAHGGPPDGAPSRI
jgi:predicted DCC family thiol-disulfide oxidoreductase YuxK